MEGHKPCARSTRVPQLVSMASYRKQFAHAWPRRDMSVVGRHAMDGVRDDLINCKLFDKGRVQGMCERETKVRW